MLLENCKSFHVFQVESSNFLIETTYHVHEVGSLNKKL